MGFSCLCSQGWCKFQKVKICLSLLNLRWINLKKHISYFIVVYESFRAIACKVKVFFWIVFLKRFETEWQLSFKLISVNLQVVNIFLFYSEYVALIQNHAIHMCGIQKWLVQIAPCFPILVWLLLLKLWGISCFSDLRISHHIVCSKHLATLHNSSSMLFDSHTELFWANGFVLFLCRLLLSRGLQLFGQLGSATFDIAWRTHYLVT